MGGGAIGVSLYGLLGGYALSGRGPGWARIVCGAVALTAIPVWALTVTSFARPGLALDTPRGAWVAVYFWSFLAVLALACTIPHRPVTPLRVCTGSEWMRFARLLHRPVRVLADLRSAPPAAAVPT